MTTINQKDRLSELLNMKFDDLDIQYKYYSRVNKQRLSDVFNHDGTVSELINRMCLNRISTSDIEKVSNEDGENITQKIIDILNEIIKIMRYQDENFYYYDKKIYLIDDLKLIIPDSLTKLTSLFSYEKIEDAFITEISTSYGFTIQYMDSDIKEFIRNISSLSDKL